nr:hypothetical protein [Tanacetum cinerariifolium]
MAQLLQAPTDGYEDAIVILEIAATNFELKHGLINLVQNKQFFGHEKEDPHAHLRYFNKITSTMRVSNGMSHHGFSELHQLDTFYNALNVNDQDSLNSAADGNFLDKMPADCLKIIESKSKVHQTRAKAVVAKVSSNSSTPAVSADVAELKDMVKALLLDKKNQYSAQTLSPTPASIKAVELNCVTCGGSGTLPGNTVTNPKEDLKGSGTLPGNTITNPKEDLKCITTQSGVAYQGPTIPTPSKVAKQGTEPVVAPVSASMPNLKPSIPYPSRNDNERRRDQANKQIKKFYEIFKEISFEISFTNALMLMPKFASTLKALIGNKEKLSEMARTLMNKHCSAVILNKLPKKLGDPGLSLPKPTPTCMTLELADRSKPVGIAKVVKVKVGVFHFPTDFMVVDFKPDSRIPLILKGCFLKTSQALIDVHKGELTLQVLGFSDVTASGSPTPSDDPIVSTTSPMLTPFGDSDFLLFEEADAFLEVEKLLDAGLIYLISDSPWVSPIHCMPKKGSFTIVANEENELIPTRLVTGWRLCIDYRNDFLLFEEADAFLGLEDYPDSPKLDPSYYDPEGDILLLEAILNSDPSPPLPNHEHSVPSFKEELKAYEAKMIKSSIYE